MKLHIKSFILLGIVFLISATACSTLIWLNFESYEARLEKERSSDIQRIVLYHLDNLQRNLETLLTNHAYWSDVERHLITGDDNWIRENVTAYLVLDTNYDVDLLYFRSDRYKHKEFYGNISANVLEKLPINNEIRSGKMLAHQFALIDNEVFLLVAAPITDNHQKHPDGIFILGKRINNQSIEQMAVLLNGQGVATIGIDILKSPIEEPFSNFEDGAHRFSQLLSRENGQYAYLSVITEDRALDIMLERTELSIALTVTFMFLLAMLVVFMLFLKTSKSLYQSVDIIDHIASGHYDLRMDLHTSKEFTRLSGSVNQLTSDFQKTMDQLKNNTLEIIGMMVEIIEITDSYTRGHSERVSHYAVAIATELGCSKDDIETLRISGLMHDVGKIAIDGAVLNKKEPLTDEEVAWIRTHPTLGYKILDLATLFSESKNVILFHHEYYNGKGYPNRLKGDDIPLLSRILCVADAFDAMTSDRSYRPAISAVRAAEIIREGSGEQFDPDVVTAFSRIALRIYSDWSNLDRSPTLEELVHPDQSHEA